MQDEGSDETTKIAVMQDLKRNYLKALREAADFEALCMKYNREYTIMKNALEELQNRYDVEIRAVSEHAGEATREAFFKEKTLEEELQHSKQQHYLLLDRMTSAEDTLRCTQEEMSRVHEMNKILGNRNIELERRMEEANRLIDKHNEEKRKITDSCAESVQIAADDSSKIRDQMLALQLQLDESSVTIKEMRDKNDEMASQVYTTTLLLRCDNSLFIAGPIFVFCIAQSFAIAA